MQNNKLGHCPYCTKIVFKDASLRFIGEMDFETSCRHCGRPIIISAQNEVIIIVKPKINVDLQPKQVDKTSQN